MTKPLLFLLCLLTWSSVQSAVLSETGVFLLPMNCSELLPDPGPFVNYFEAVGRGMVTSNKKLSNRIFRVLAIREKVTDAMDRQRDQHPIDIIIRKTLCFFREQKEPLKPVLYDDENFISYLSAAISEIDTKVNEVVYQWELDLAQRLEYEKIIDKNQQLILSMKRQAEKEAEAEVKKIAQRAKAKAKFP